jgi:hypothetical protein
LAAFGLLLYDGLYYVLANFGSSAKPIVLAGRRLPWISTTATAELLLALGTAALAYAAIEQARAAFAQVEAANAFAEAAGGQTRAIWAQSLAQNRPHLAIEVFGGSVLSTERATPRVLGPGDLLAMGQEANAFHVLNTGPGVAAQIEVAVHGYLPAASEPKILNSTRWIATVLGPGKRSVVSFPTPLAAELWGDTAIGEKFAMIVWATGIVAWPEYEEEGDIPDESRCGALGGLIAESVRREDNGGIAYAWRVLSSQECSELVNQKIRPLELPAWPGTLGRRTARVHP